MKNDSEHDGQTNLRAETRTETRKKASVEFIPGKNEMTYHFKLKNFSSTGLGIIVRKDSNVLKHIKIGDILTMKYYSEASSAHPVFHQTQIKHISEPDPEKQQDHLLVGLSILD
ncbi:hypothetical protein [Desulfobacula sp.]|uniref:hypothetical protein n=1 Tax=Desulfobacula sp. TaxID=2593537 RepID=UPI002631743E|nr:hypothetical protein [Desulfobacula sp.]